MEAVFATYRCWNGSLTLRLRLRSASVDTSSWCLLRKFLIMKRGQVSASATATIVNSVTALFSKTCNQKALLLRMQAMKAWHALTQTLRSKRAAVAARALSLEPGAPEARLIFRSWHQQALTYRTTRERLQQQARQAAFARLRGGVLIWAAWSKRKRVSRRHCERLTLQVNLSVMSDSDVFLH